jgi:hypothetical protein
VGEDERPNIEWILRDIMGVGAHNFQAAPFFYTGNSKGVIKGRAVCLRP